MKMGLRLKISKIIQKYPIARGVVTFGVLYPTSNFTQQILDPKRKELDLKETLRFGIFGPFVIAPTLYGWVRLASFIIPGNTLKHCVIKALVEQFTWAPFAYCQFYIGITTLEGRPWDERVMELKNKFWPTWKAGFCVWPIIQTVNFWLIPERNRVPFVSFCSFIWTMYLSYMHHRKVTLPDTITP